MASDLDYQSPEVGERRYSRMAILSITLPFGLIFIMAIILSSPPLGRSHPALNLFLWLLYFLAVISGVGFGVAGIIGIRRAKGKLRGLVYSCGGLVIGIVILLAPLASYLLTHG